MAFRGRRINNHEAQAVTSDTPETRTELLEGIERIAVNVGRAAGLPDGRLPRKEMKGGIPVTVNDTALVKMLSARWQTGAQRGRFCGLPTTRYGWSGFSLSQDRALYPELYFAIAGTTKERFER